MKVSLELYLPGTAILITRFMTPGGVGEVLNFNAATTLNRELDRRAGKVEPAIAEAG